MVVSQAEREELIRRVTRRVTGRPAADALVRGAVDRVVAALEARPAALAPAGERVVVITAASTPDLASRLQAAIGDRGVLRGPAVASEGRHTVVVGRVAAGQLEAVRAAAERVGARFVAREEA